jgi:hypothetical protein
MRALIASGLLLIAPVTAGAQLLGYGLNMQDQLVTFNVTAPGTLLSAHFIQGLQPNEHLLAIDFRPTNGRLYGLGSFNWLYQIDTATGAATRVGAAPFAPQLNGTEFDLDFNPVTDRITVLSELGQNLTLNPDTGQLVTAGPTITGGRILGAGYSNNVPGASTTTLYGLGTAAGTVLRLFDVNPTSGAATALAFNTLPAGDIAGVDVVGASTGFFLESSLGGIHRLYTADLATASGFSLLGDFQGGSLMRDIAIPGPGGLGVLALAAAGFLRRRR